MKKVTNPLENQRVVELIKQHKTIPVDKIVERDLRVNYKGMPKEQGMKQLYNLQKAGYPVVRFLNTLFVIVDVNNNVATFHTLSGDNKKFFLIACFMFYWHMKKQGFDEVQTEFENKKVIDELLKYPDGVMESWESVEKTDNGYLLRVDLNGMGEQTS
jgi:hypothetical protein